VRLAYRLVPLDDSGRPVPRSTYTLISDVALAAGDQVNGWEVVSCLPEAEARGARLLAVRDKDGVELEILGTVICRRIESSPPP
jgi:hypothetical protein